jgi:hypothetical protein
MTENKKLFSTLTLLSHYFTLNGVSLVDKLGYNLLSLSQIVDADLDVLFRKSSSQVLNSSSRLACGISRIGKVFQADFSFSQSFIKCLISQPLSDL